jgi:hypothetical protein
MNRIDPRAGLGALVCALMLLSSAAAQTPAPELEACAALVVAADGSLSLAGEPGYRVSTAIPPLAPPPGVAAFNGILCDRDRIFIGPVDHRVLTDLHVPLYIRNNGRLAILEVTAEGAQVRFNQGAPTAEEREALAIALDRATEALLAMPPAPAP